MGTINVCNNDDNLYQSTIIESKSSTIISNDFTLFEKIQDKDKLKDYIPY